MTGPAQIAPRKSYAAIDIHHASVSAWPQTLPKMTGPEAVRAASRLWRWARGETCPIEIRQTSGNRYNWTHRGIMLVNPDRGWRHFVHDLSHLFVRRENPGMRPHSKFHERFEAKMIREVLKRGWLDGRLRDAAPVPTTAEDRKRRKLDAINERIARWESKERRAHRAIVKLNKSRRYYERELDQS